MPGSSETPPAGGGLARRQAMEAELEDWKNGWFGLRLAASPREIEHLISLLQDLLKDPDSNGIRST